MIAALGFFRRAQFNAAPAAVSPANAARELDPGHLVQLCQFFAKLSGDCKKADRLPTREESKIASYQVCFYPDRHCRAGAQPANREPGIQPAVPKKRGFPGFAACGAPRNDNLPAPWYQFSSLKYFALTLRD